MNKNKAIPALMFQGTSSSAGKSLLTTAFCRLLADKGIKVAPFKAQNMSLNSHVAAGLEMGRAQALQAVACNVPPDARMNPVLLKPLGHNLSQVIVLGKPVGTMSYAQYTAIKSSIWRKVKEAYASLSEEMDFIVLEGAGSPAEINLRQHDIVNMRMAAHAGAKVVLVADIDRGGAFASIAGTMMLLGRNDRRRIAGYVLNKFRGDADLLRPALDAVSARTGRPFFGIMPYLANLRLPEEDSVGFAEIFRHSRNGQKNTDNVATLDVAVVELPAISNFTDFDALAMEPGVRLRLVKSGAELGNPHFLILPGTRNVFAALDFLISSGLHTAIKNYAAIIREKGAGCIAGICGGLQMLGLEINDPDGIEGGGLRTGLGLLPLWTTMGSQKILRNSSGYASELLCGGRHGIQGYEIHHGRSDFKKGVEEVIHTATGQPLGWAVKAGERAPIWGTYLHGIFDSDNFRHAFLQRLRSQAQFGPCQEAAYSINPEIDRLAAVMAENLDINALLDGLMPDNPHIWRLC